VNYNKVILGGHMTRDVLMKVVGGTPLADFGLATNRKWTNKDGTKGEKACFVDCTAWGRTAETIGKFFSKGDPVLIEGELELDQWQDKDGQNRSKIKIRVTSFAFTGKYDESATTKQTAQPATAQPAHTATPFGAPEANPEDTPFG